MEIKEPRDGVIPKDIEGKTFQQMFEMVRVKNHEILEKMKRISGLTFYTPEVEAFLTDEEIGWLRLAKFFYSK